VQLHSANRTFFPGKTSTKSRELYGPYDSPLTLLSPNRPQGTLHRRDALRISQLFFGKLAGVWPTAWDRLLKLADWARWLVAHWKAWNHALWVWAFGSLGIHLKPEWALVLSFLLFGSLLAIGQAFKFNMAINNGRPVDGSQDKSFQLVSWRAFFYLLSIMPAFLVGLQLESLVPRRFYHLSLGIGMLFGILVAFFSPLIAFIVFARHRLYAACSAFLLAIFNIIIVLYPMYQIWSEPGYPGAAYFSSLLFVWLLPLILLSVTPAKAVSRRLIFLAIGLILLIALNELSKFALDVAAPKLQG
jgi:hypothetical protein